MRAAIVLLLFTIGCKTAPVPAAPHAAGPDAGVDAPVAAAPPKDPLPDAVERVVQLYEALDALPADASCERTRAAMAALRTKFAADLAAVRRARVERPAEVETLWVAQQARLAAAWIGMQRPDCPGAADDIDPLEEP